MSQSLHSSFLYHASAFALSGHLKRPAEHLIEVQAGSTLPTTGGQGSARVENFRLDQMISFKAGYSRVSGSEKVENGKVIHTTLATVTIEGLNIFDVVTADRVVARLASSFESGSEAHILIMGSRFENLRIAGCKVDVELHHELALKLATFEAARKEFESNEEFRKMSDDPLNPGRAPKKLDASGVIRCSIVKELKPTKCPGVEHRGHHGHVLVVPEFGTVHLAEVVIEHGRKILTMLRIDLGSPNGGGTTVGQADSNGRPPSGG